MVKWHATGDQETLLSLKMYFLWLSTRIIVSIWNYLKKVTQPAFTRSKLTIETLEQGVKYVQS